MIDDADTRFISNIIVGKFIQKHGNQNTQRNPHGHLKLFRLFLWKQNEIIEIHKIHPSEMNFLLSKFLLSVRKKVGEEYEQCSLRSMLGSFERYFKRSRLKSGYEFLKCREDLLTLSKQKDLKCQGKRTQTQCIGFNIKRGN